MNHLDGDLQRQRSSRDLVLQGMSAFNQNRLAEAQRAYEQAVEIDKDCVEAYFGLSRIRYPGESYLELLSKLHKHLRPKTYVEVGVGNGGSLERTLPTTASVGIDPAPTLDPRIARRGRIFPLRSNEFFSKHDLRAIFDGRPIDMAFIDGLHLFESVIQDFINLEKACAKGSIVLIHDCLPFNALTSSRRRQTRFWTGDVWRTLPVLKKYRPDLSLALIECAPSGLAVIQSLDPASQALASQRDEMMAYGMNLNLDSLATLVAENVRIISADWANVEKLFLDVRF
jgi:hypothetical protein